LESQGGVPVRMSLRRYQRFTLRGCGLDKPSEQDSVLLLRVREQGLAGMLRPGTEEFDHGLVSPSTEETGRTHGGQETSATSTAASACSATGS
jgi:hypothetical protein